MTIISIAVMSVEAFCIFFLLKALKKLKESEKRLKRNFDAQKEIHDREKKLIREAYEKKDKIGTGSDSQRLDTVAGILSDIE